MIPEDVYTVRYRQGYIDTHEKPFIIRARMGDKVVPCRTVNGAKRVIDKLSNDDGLRSSR